MQNTLLQSDSIFTKTHGQSIFFKMLKYLLIDNFTHDKLPKNAVFFSHKEIKI